MSRMLAYAFMEAVNAVDGPPCRMPQHIGVLVMPSTSFRSNKENAKFLEELNNRSAFLNSLIELARTGDLPIKIINENHDTKIIIVADGDMDELNLMKTKAQIQKIEQTTQQSKQTTRLTKLRANFLETTGHAIPRKLEHEITSNESYKAVTNQKINCPACSTQFEYFGMQSLIMAKENFMTHYHSRHGMLKNEILEEIKAVVCR